MGYVASAAKTTFMATLANALVSKSIYSKPLPLGNLEMDLKITSHRQKLRIVSFPFIIADFCVLPFLEPSSTKLSTLIGYIQSLQSTGRFPDCELGNLELLSPDRTFSDDQPALLDPSECWDKPCDPEDVFYALHRATVSKPAKSARFQVVRNGIIIQGKPREKAISTALFQAHSPSFNHNVYSLMNIVLPKDLWHLQPCDKLQNALHLDCQGEKLELNANFATTGAFVDVHIGWCSISQFLPCKTKLFLRSEPPWSVAVTWR